MGVSQLPYVLGVNLFENFHKPLLQTMSVDNMD